MRWQHHSEIGVFLGGVVVAFPPSQEHSRAGGGGSRDMGDQSLGKRNAIPKVPLILVPSQGGMCVTDAAAERPDTEQQVASLPLAL